MMKTKSTIDSEQDDQTEKRIKKQLLFLTFLKKIRELVSNSDTGSNFLLKTN